jgi:hypothetical protein
MRRHLYPVTKDEIVNVLKLKYRKHRPAIRNFVLDVAYEAVTLTAGLFLAFQLLDKIIY